MPRSSATMSGRWTRKASRNSWSCEVITGSNPASPAALARKSASTGSSSISSNRGCVIWASPSPSPVAPVRDFIREGQRERNALLTALSIKSQIGAISSPTEAFDTMFASLIRRRPAYLETGSGDEAFESTTFSLSTAVPRPMERRNDDRLPAVTAMLRVGKLTTAAGEQQLIRVRNVSAGGLMAFVTKPPSIGDRVAIEMSSQQISSTVLWIRDDVVGFKFDHNLDLGELLAGRKPRHGFRARPPRLEVNCKASVRVGKLYYSVNVHDISLGGMKVEPIEEYCLGKKVVVVVESLRPIKGEVRWFSDRKAGIVFEEELRFDE